MWPVPSSFAFCLFTFALNRVVVAGDRLRPAVVDVFPRGVEVAARVLRRGGGVVTQALGEEVRVFGRARDLLLHELLYVGIGHEVWIVAQVSKLLRSLFRHLPTSKVPAIFPPEKKMNPGPAKTSTVGCF